MGEDQLGKKLGCADLRENKKHEENLQACKAIECERVEGERCTMQANRDQYVTRAEFVL